MTELSQRAAPASLEEVADALVERLMESMPAGGAYGHTALARLPGPVSHLLAAALDRRVARETAPPTTDWIDPDDPEVREAARHWREAVREAGRYPPDAWPAALADAARQSLRHLVEPADAAAAFCFAGESGPIPVAAVRARLSAFGPYPYLREIAERYAERKGLEQMDRAGLVTLLRRIDRRMTSGFGAGEWDALAAPLYSLVGGLPGLDGRVPSEVLGRFFAARGADALAEAVAGRPAWGPAELHDAVAAVVGGGKGNREKETEGAGGAEGAEEAEGGQGSAAVGAPLVGGPDAQAGTLEATVGAADAAVAAPEARAHAVGEDASRDESLEELFGVPAAVPAAAPPPRLGAPEAEAPAADDDGTVELDRTVRRDEALWQAFAAGRGPVPADADETDVPGAEPLWQRLARTQSEPAKPEPPPALPPEGLPPEPLGRLEARVLGPDALAQRDWFVAHVAGGSESAYRRLLEGLDAAPTWADAWPLLAAAFRAHDVDIYSEPAVALTDAAEARFGDGGRQ